MGSGRGGPAIRGLIIMPRVGSSCSVAKHPWHNAQSDSGSSIVIEREVTAYASLWRSQWNAGTVARWRTRPSDARATRE